jgi:hypothetical protein
MGNPMEEHKLLIVAMAEQCRELIIKSGDTQLGLLPTLRPKHLLWMCDNIQQHAEHWPTTKLHRWIGFVQGGMMANRMLDLDGAKAMFDKAKNAFGEIREDHDLVDHLDPRSSFEMDIGGQG